MGGEDGTVMMPTMWLPYRRCVVIASLRAPFAAANHGLSDCSLRAYILSCALHLVMRVFNFP